MNKLFLGILLICSFVCCKQNQVYYSEDFLVRYTTKDVYPGCLFIPISPDGHCFMVMDNDVVRARLYYDNYYDSFPSYQSFLNCLMNQPGVIDIKNAFGFVELYYANDHIIKESRDDFAGFITKYLREQSVYYVINDKYKDFSVSIAKACFDHRYYIYPPGCFSDWIVSTSPETVPPIIE